MRRLAAYVHTLTFEQRFLCVLAMVLLIWGLTDVRMRGRVDPNNPLAHKTDFTCYTVAADALWHGADPYQVKNIRGWGYPYPPLLAVAVMPLLWLDPQMQVVVWYLVSVLACYACYFEARRVFRFFSAELRAATRELDGARQAAIEKLLAWLPWLALAAVAFPTLNCLQRGQVGVFKAYFLTLGLRLLIERASFGWSLVAGLIFALAVVLKVTPIFVVGIFGFLMLAKLLLAPAGQRGGVTTAGAVTGLAVGIVLFALLIPAAAVGWNENLSLLTRWTERIPTRVNDSNDADVTGNTRTFRNQSLSNAIFRAGNWIDYQFAGGPNDLRADEFPFPRDLLVMDSPRVERVLLVVRAALGFLLLIAAIGIARQPARLDEAALFGMACIGMLILSPIGRGHYYMEELPALVCVPIWFARRGELRWAWAAMVIPASLCVAHYVLMSITGRIGLLGIGTSVWYLAVMCQLISSGFRPQAVAVVPARSRISESRRAA